MDKSPESIDQQLADDRRAAAECESAESDAARADWSAKLSIRAYAESLGLVAPMSDESDAA